MKIRITNGMNRRDVELPMSDSELTLHMKQIGVDESIPQCKLIGVRDKANPLAPFIDQIVNLDEVNFLAKRMESLTDYERNVMDAYVTERGVEEIKDLINLTFSLKGLSLITDFSDGEQVGKRLYLDEFLGMSEEESRQINFTEFAEKTFAEQFCKILPYGVWVEHGFEMQEVYNGRTFPLYCYDSDKVAALEIQNQRGDTEYLYLPTDICSVNKMKARLQVQDFWECKVKEVHNFHIPDSILPRSEDIKCIEDLTFFNELCQNICRFDEQKMKQLSMAVEFVGVKDFTDMTYIARTLSEFEIHSGIHSGIHSDEEYGKYLVSDEGLFDVDDLLLPHIDYAGLARDKRQGTLTDSEYVSEGFVGANRDIHEYMEYEGELNRAVMEAIHRITRNDGDFVGAFRQNVIRVIGNYGMEHEPDEYEDKIKVKQQEMVALIAENAKTGSYTQEFDERYRSIAEEIEILKKEQTEARKKKRLVESYEQRVKDMDAFIKGSTCQIPEFDNDLVRRLISSIKVVSAEKLIIQFQSGIVMEQEIRYD